MAKLLTILMAFLISASVANAKPTIGQTIAYLEGAGSWIVDGTLKVNDGGVFYTVATGTDNLIWFPFDATVYLEVKSTRCWDGDCETDDGKYMVVIKCTQAVKCTGFSHNSENPVVKPNNESAVFGVLPDVTEARRVANAVAHLASLMGRSLAIIDRTAEAIDGSAFD